MSRYNELLARVQLKRIVVRDFKKILNMISNKAGPMILPSQIDLQKLFTVERILSSRGFQIIREGTGLDTIIPRQSWGTDEFNLVFDVFDDPQLRTELLNHIENGPTSQQSQKLSQVAHITDVCLERQAFSHTFEWYVGELLCRKFMSLSSSYGVTVKNVLRNSDNETAGDYDVLSVLGDTNLLYIECKTGKYRQAAIRNTVERASSLHCTAAIILLGDGLKGNALGQQLKDLQYPGLGQEIRLYEVGVKGIPESKVMKWHDCFFVAANESSGDLKAKLNTVLRMIAAKRTQLLRFSDVDSEGYNNLGYDIRKVSV